jgi:DNA-binding CsgD family transcriptional regulator/PAS domain-containing protein
MQELSAAAHEVITAFYDAALGSTPWDRALELATGYLGAHAGVFSCHDPVTRVSRFGFGQFGTDAAFSESFRKTYSAMSPFPLGAMLAKVGEATKPFDLVGRAEVLKGRFFSEWCRPQNYNDFMGAILTREARVLHAIAFVRLGDQPMFDETDLARLQAIVPHVIRAITVADRVSTLQSEQQDVLAAIDRLPIGLLIVDGDRRVRQSNRAALDLLNGDAQLSLADGTLTITDDDQNRTFRRAFDQARISPLTLSLPGGKPLLLSLLPQDLGGTVNDGRRAFVFIHPPQFTPPAGGEVLKARFGFTTAELRVLMMLMEGGTRETIATDLGLSLATIKSQMQGLFRKTGTSRQADLIRQIMGVTGAAGA